MGSLLPSDEFEGYTHQHRFGDGIFISTGTSRPPSRTLSAPNIHLQGVDEAAGSGEETDGAQQEEVWEVEDGDARREEAYLAHSRATGLRITNGEASHAEGMAEGMAEESKQAEEVEKERTSEWGEGRKDGKQGDSEGGEGDQEGEETSEGTMGPWRGGHLIVPIALYERIMRAMVAVR